MKPEHETRRKIIREWMSLPKDKRQTEEQAKPFAKKAMERIPSSSDPYRQIMSNCVVGSGGSRLPCSTIAEHSVEGCDHFSHDGHDDDLGFFVGGDEAIVEGFEGGTVTACTEGGHVKDVTDR